jgi:hypothetical protein
MVEFAFMAFDVRNFLRQISVELLQAYFTSKGSDVAPDWLKLSHIKLAGRLADRVMSGEDPASAAILANLTRLLPMATELGRVALLNAAAEEPTVAERFAGLANDHERALWMLMAHESLFQEGESLHFFDHYAEGNRGRHYRTTAGIEMSEDAQDRSQFTRDICKFYRKRDGSGVSCYAEYSQRRAEGFDQVTLYVQGLPSHSTELIDGEFTRRVSHPTVDAAIVYDPRTGNTTTVANGGEPVHEALRQAFAQKLLKIDPKFDVVAKRRFHLESLKQPRRLDAAPELGVKSIRVRRLTLAPPDFAAGRLTVEAPSRNQDIGVYDVSNRWFVEKAGLLEKFKVVHATISIHFQRPPTAKRTKTINLELSSATSNLHSLVGEDRAIAERHIEMWQLFEPAR